MTNKGKHLKTKPFLEQKNPGVAALALTTLVETGSANAAAKVAKISDHTVLAIAERLPEDFANIKKLRGMHHFNLAEKAMTELDGRDYSEASLVNLSVMSGIHTQRGLECVAREIPMMFDPQLARRCIEESEFWRRQMQQPTVVQEIANGQDNATEETKREEAGDKTEEPKS
jgi:hypothetical protein